MRAASQRLPHAPASLLALRRRLLAWWWSLPAHLRSPAWPFGFACMTILALLLGFHQVVATAVQQGEVFRVGVASHAEAVSRCNALRSARVRASCLRQLEAPPTEQASEPPPPNTASLAVAQSGR
ncbi:MAG TPA: hypothetical protein VJ743_23495 [Albitalea sp.]|nr:hypothetical protein [Albitalea sp.]